MIELIRLFLADFLMFQPQTYQRLLANYNQTLWPMQLVALLLGLALLWLLFKRPKQADRLINTGLCICWLWVGVVFHLQYFASINWAAWGFGALFMLQAALLLLFGVLLNKVTYQHVQTPVSRFGLLVFLFALVVYPLLTALMAGDWAQGHYFGTSADGTCLATMGLLMIVKSGWRWLLAVLPVIWLVISVVMGWVLSANI